MLARLRRFAVEDDSGVVLIETLIAIPVLTLLTFGILEFGNMMWQRQQVQVGVRDAARYWARCRPGFMPGCTTQIAENIAFYGNPAGTGSLRVPGWDDSSELSITPATPPTNPGPADIVVVEGSVVYQGSPVFSAVLGDTVTLRYWHTTRYIGW